MLLPLILTVALQQAPPFPAAALDSAVSAEALSGFSGVVLVARGDTVRFARLYGRAATLGVAAPELAFWLASNSKQFTATAILRLAELGRLSIRDSIGRFWPDAPPDKRGITVHQLLTHRSGLPQAYRADGVRELDRAVRAILGLRLEFRPGEKYLYSNDGYTLLAAIIERASGVTFDRFMRDSLFAKAGLWHTGLWGHEREDVRIAPVANPRAVASQRPTIFTEGHSVANWGYRGPTGAYASAGDVLRWIRALQDGRIISPASVRELLGHHVVVRSDSTGTSYGGYAWGIRVEGGRDVLYGHGGNEDWLGHNGVMRFTPDQDVVIVLSNSGDSEGTGWSARVNKVVRRVLDPRP